MESLLGLYVEATWDRDDISYRRPLPDGSMRATAEHDFQQSTATQV
jgi:hypothetical protein